MSYNLVQKGIAKAIQVSRSSALYKSVIAAIQTGIKPKVRETMYNIANRLLDQPDDLFKSVAIETTSICNKRCTYCPNSSDELRSLRPMKDMDHDVYEKVIDDLQAIRYMGSIALQHYGEPLLDSALEKRIKLAKEKLPHPSIMINSNGDYLTPERYESLVDAGIDLIAVTIHDESTRERLKPLLQHLKRKEEPQEHLEIREGIRTLSNRGGLIEVPENKKRETAGPCVQESYSLNIDVEGNVVMCSEDYLGRKRFGNVQDTNIRTIWESWNFRSIRNLHKQGVFLEDICKACEGKN